MAIAALAAIAVAWTRLLPLNQSLSGGEASTVEHYVARGPSAIFGSYGPGDHMLFALLTWLTTTITRDFTTPAYRFWSVVPAVAAAALLTWWLWRRLDAWIAVAFAVLATAAPPYLIVSVEAGGYGLALLAAAVMVISTDSLVRRRSPEQLLWFTAGAIVGIWSLPVFALAVAAWIGVLTVRPWLRRDALQATAMISVASLIFYLPVLSGVWSAAGRDLGPQLNWHGFVSRPLEDLIGPMVRVVWPGLSVTAAAAIGGALVTAGLVILWRRPERMLALTLVVPALFGYLVAEAGRFQPSAQFLSFLELPLLVVCAVPIGAAVASLVSRPRVAVPASGLALALSAFALIRADVSFQDLGRSTTWTPAFATQAPQENFSGAAALVDAASVRTVVTTGSALEGLNHYLEIARARALDPSQLTTTLCSGLAPFAYVQPGDAPPAGLACLQRRLALSIRVPSSRVPITVWFVPLRAPS